MNDDTLILYYYGDGLSDEERAAVRIALEQDARLLEQYRLLCRSLDRFNDVPDTKAPPAMAARLHAQLERAADAERRRNRGRERSWHFPSFAWGALAAGLAVAVVMTFLPRDGIDPGPSTADVVGETPGEGSREDQTADPPYEGWSAPVSFTRGLQVHLRESRQGLLRLAPGEDQDRSALVMDIMWQNRLFERAARENDAGDIARVLRAFEPILLRLASDDISAEDAAALTDRLAFELNVVLTKMARGESDDTQSI